MKATTLKIENPLLDDLNQIRPQAKSLSAFVRSILEQAVLRQKMIQAANQYCELLQSNPEENEWLMKWENFDLANPPRKAAINKQSKKRKKP